MRSLKDEIEDPEMSIDLSRNALEVGTENSLKFAAAMHVYQISLVFFSFFYFILGIITSCHFA